MKASVILLSLLMASTLGAQASAADRDNNPPGRAGGPGTNWENQPGPRGGPGASPDYRRDRDNNPPGPAGGGGTNWENPPGPAGGPGASPDRHKVFTPEQREKLKNMSPEQRRAYLKHLREQSLQRRDRDNNPPGQAGGAGTNWENPPGPAGGPGTSPDFRPQLTPEQREKLRAMTPEQRREFFERLRENRQDRRADRDGNPPGPVGGAGTNWENPRGPAGGPGASPDLR
jgi:Spy/CpxP family protein refolding chaperone